MFYLNLFHFQSDLGCEQADASGDTWNLWCRDRHAVAIRFI
jgi:hypothetical protein